MKAIIFKIFKQIFFFINVFLLTIGTLFLGNYELIMGSTALNKAEFARGNDVDSFWVCRGYYFTPTQDIYVTEIYGHIRNNTTFVVGVWELQSNQKNQTSYKIEKNLIRKEFSTINTRASIELNPTVTLEAGKGYLIAQGLKKGQSTGNFHRAKDTFNSSIPFIEFLVADGHGLGPQYCDDLNNDTTVNVNSSISNTNRVDVGFSFFANSINFLNNDSTGSTSASAIIPSIVQMGGTAIQSIDLSSPEYQITRAGYNFDGWVSGGAILNELPATMPEGVIDLVAQWTPITYNINFDGNTSDSGTMDSILATYDETINLPANSFNKIGHTFNAWNFQTDGSGTSFSNLANISNLSTISGSSVTLYAQWNINQYTLNFETFTGSAISSLTADFGNPIQITPPSLTGYQFTGWYIDDTFITPFNYATMPDLQSSSVTLFAKWEMITFDIAYELTGGTNSDENPHVFTIENLPLFISPSSKPGFVFDGWQIITESQEFLTPSGLISIGASTSGITASIHNYQLFLGNSSWTSARDYCSNLGGYLATVTSAIEWNYILQKILQNSNPNDRYWLGAEALNKNSNASAVQQNWQWLNDEGPVPLIGQEGFQNWANGEPNNHGAGEYYLTTWGNQTWNDLPNNPGGMHGFVCEFDQLINLSNSITLTAVYIANSYTINFVSNGGTSFQTQIVNTEEVLDLPIPTRGDDVFDGWYKDSGLTIAFKESLMPPQNLVLYAKWSELIYTVTYYNLWDGSNNQDNPSQFTFSSPNLTLIAPTRIGFSFQGWYLESDFSGGQITEIPSGTRTNIALYANWIPNIYTLTLNANGGSSVSEIIADYLSAISLPSASRQGYRFDGWFEDGVRVTYTEMPLENRTLEARWTPLPYTLTFVNSITGEQTTLTASFNAPIQMPQINQPGYTFGGWLENNRPVRFTTMPLGNRTLIASFNPRNYTISFSSSLGTAPSSIEAAYQSIINLPPMNVEHHTFKGWQGPSGLNQGSFQVPLNGASLTAVFEPKLYTVSFTGEGIDIPSMEIPFEGALSLPTPSKEGYRFTGWLLNGSPVTLTQMPGENLTLVGSFERTELTLRLISEGQVLRQSTHFVNDSFSLPTPQKRGHTFEGWFEGNTRVSSGVMPSRNLTLNARFLINSYPVTFTDYDSSETLRFEYNSTIELPQKERLGYQFMGWSFNGQIIEALTISDTVVELTAVYQPFNARMTFASPSQVLTLNLTTDQSLSNITTLSVPSGYVWQGFFTLPFGAGDVVQSGFMVENAHDVTIYPYYLRAGQTFDVSSGRLSLDPYYANERLDIEDIETQFPWLEVISLLMISTTLISFHVLSKGGKMHETI